MTELAKKEDAAQDRKHVEIKPSQRELTEFQRQSHTVVALPGQQIEDLLNPRAWASVAQSIRAWDRIEVIAEDGSYLAELFVVSVSRQHAAVKLINFTDLTEGDDIEAIEDAADHIVKWRGPVMKFCVVRVSDNSNIEEKIDTKEEAMKALNQYEKALTI